MPEARIKPLQWLGDSRRRVREFAATARQRVGFELWEVQQGHEPSDWKPMPMVGEGVKEIRVHADGEHRVLYVAKFEEAVYVLHGFAKKTRRTSKHDIELAAGRFRTLVQERRKHEEAAKGRARKR
jgi:phage-related protein